MKSFLLSLLSFFSFLSITQAQDELPENFDPAGPYLYLTDGTLLQEGEFTYEKKWITKYYDLEGGEIVPSRLQFVKTSSVLFGYIHSSPRSHEKIQCEEEGLFNIFFRSQSTRISDGSFSSTKSYYYSKPLGEIYELNGVNLLRDLILLDVPEAAEVNQEIRSLLTTADRKDRQRWTQSGIGLGTFLVGALIFYSTEVGSPVNWGSLGVCLVGVGTIVTAPWGKGKKLSFDALRRYNEAYPAFIDE
ncbi:MAG: hypothetical protein AAGH79_17530 [Bacteroidota bacterium]